MNDVELKNLSTLAKTANKLLEMWFGDVWYRGIPSRKLSAVPSLYWRKLAAVEEHICREFVVSYGALTDEMVSGPWELYALMRHHGLPTRLLDWTRSPLTAVYFALTERKGSDRGPAVIWAMNPNQLNGWAFEIDAGWIEAPNEFGSREVGLGDGRSFDIDKYLPATLDPISVGDRTIPNLPLAIESPLASRRITAQQGCFTIHGSRKKGIEKVFAERSDAPDFVTIEIPADKVAGLKETLYDVGINEETVFPELDSLVHRIIREYS